MVIREDLNTTPNLTDTTMTSALSSAMATDEADQFFNKFCTVNEATQLAAKILEEIIFEKHGLTVYIIPADDCLKICGNGEHTDKSFFIIKPREGLNSSADNIYTRLDECVTVALERVDKSSPIQTHELDKIKDLAVEKFKEITVTSQNSIGSTLYNLLNGVSIEFRVEKPVEAVKQLLDESGWEIWKTTGSPSNVENHKIEIGSGNDKIWISPMDYRTTPNAPLLHNWALLCEKEDKIIFAFCGRVCDYRHIEKGLGDALVVNIYDKADMKKPIYTLINPISIEDTTTRKMEETVNGSDVRLVTGLDNVFDDKVIEPLKAELKARVLRVNNQEEFPKANIKLKDTAFAGFDFYKYVNLKHQQVLTFEHVDGSNVNIYFGLNDNRKVQIIQVVSEYGGVKHIDKPEDRQTAELLDIVQKIFPTFKGGNPGIGVVKNQARRFFAKIWS